MRQPPFKKFSLIDELSNIFLRWENAKLDSFFFERYARIVDRLDVERVLRGAGDIILRFVDFGTKAFDKLVDGSDFARSLISDQPIEGET